MNKTDIKDDAFMTFMVLNISIMLFAALIAILAAKYNLITFPPTWLLIVTFWGLTGAYHFCRGKTGRSLYTRWLIGFSGSVIVGGVFLYCISI
ncbi:hypothetical protein EKL85_21510 [Salmonella enterica subsp. enterica serovar Give]|nr:hypothetical protein [Salmonella enterica subsp. enterica serovar Give]ECA4141859.1 hypothetical protein [Salmonella enterica subsp. enterica serovar Give]